MWKTNGWNHLACAYIGLGKFDEAIALAERCDRAEPAARQHRGLRRHARARASTGPRRPPPRRRRPGKPASRSSRCSRPATSPTAPALVADGNWRVRRAALAATRFRFASENDIDVTPARARRRGAVLADTVGSMNREAVLCRALALQIREQAYFARDPVPRLGDRMTREAFYQEFRARGGVVLGEDAPPPPPFKDRVVVPGTKVARASDYVALLRDLAALRAARGARAVRSRRRRLPRGREGLGRGDRADPTHRRRRSPPASRSAERA